MEGKSSTGNESVSSSAETISERNEGSPKHLVSIKDQENSNEVGSSSDESYIDEEHGTSCECNECLERKLEVKSTVQNLINLWVEKTLQKGIVGLRKEFCELQKEVVPPASACQEHYKNAKTGRNRYDNVYCLDKTRVKLTAEPNANDYIHANYVDTPLKDHRFICTQGPTTTSITDFWRMVWQEHVQFIIMLSNFEENGREKCAHYFPEKSGATIQFDQFIICCVYCSRMTDSKYSILCRELSLKVDGDARAVAIKHFQWAEWPDHGVPETDRSVLRVLDKVRMSNRPIVVHCSAGIGRSGVVITIECVLEAMYSQEDCSDMLALLKQLRQQRAGLVQTVQQYLFVHRLLLLMLMDRKRLKSSEAINNFINDYESFVH